jgi:flagellar biosynthesis/type III secretory pathway protein FliH
MSDEVETTIDAGAFDTKMNTPANSQDPDEDVDDKVEAETTTVEVIEKATAAAEHFNKELLSRLESDRHQIAEGAYNKGADDGIKAGILMGLVAGGALLFIGWLAWNGLGSFSEPTDASKRSNE